MKNNLKKKIKGFTIIEMMIAIAVFTIIVMVGMSTLLNASSVHQKSNDQRAIIDNMNFILEEMSRNIRTGYNIRCENSSVDVNEIPKNCLGGGQTIIFESSEGESGNSGDQWVYQFYISGGGIYGIRKSIDGGLNYMQLNPQEVEISGSSGFWVSGAELGNLDNQQPLVVIRLNGNILGKGGTRTPFSLQTTVSSRLIDRP